MGALTYHTLTGKSLLASGGNLKTVSFGSSTCAYVVVKLIAKATGPALSQSFFFAAKNIVTGLTNERRPPPESGSSLLCNLRSEVLRPQETLSKLDSDLETVVHRYESTRPLQKNLEAE
jgi:hypothetical protein